MPACSSPSHGENRGSSPLGSASYFNNLRFRGSLVSRLCPVEVLVQLCCQQLPLPLTLADEVVRCLDATSGIPKNLPPTAFPRGGLVARVIQTEGIAFSA
jgi:hypothetical protein